MGSRLGVEAALHLEREKHVVERGAPREQIVVLRDVADAAVEPGAQRLGAAHRDGVSLKDDLAGARDVDLGDQVEQGRLAGARRADDGEEFALPDRERQVADHPGRGLAALARGKALAEIADFEERRLRHGSGSDVVDDDLRRGPPAEQEPLAAVHQPIEGMDDERCGENGDENLGGVEIHGADLDEIAQAAVRGDQLGDDRGADRVGHGDPEPGEDAWNRRRKDDVARDLTLACADELRHLDELGVKRAHARRAW